MKNDFEDETCSMSMGDAICQLVSSKNVLEKKSDSFPKASLHNIWQKDENAFSDQLKAGLQWIIFLHIFSKFKYRQV